MEALSELEFLLTLKHMDSNIHVKGKGDIY